MNKQLCDEIELMQFNSPVKIKDWDRYMQEFRDNQNRVISPLRLLDESRISVNQQIKEERASQSPRGDGHESGASFDRKALPNIREKSRSVIGTYLPHLAPQQLDNFSTRNVSLLGGFHKRTSHHKGNGDSR